MARILIIDDEHDMRFFLREILEAAGHEVHDAIDGAAGLRLFRQTRPELVITDIFMPEQDGLEVIRALKREFPTVKIIAMSGGGAFDDLMFLRASQSLGADQILPKPFLPHEILALIHKFSDEMYISN